MSMNIRFPNISGATEAEQISQIKSYLHQLVQQLNWVLTTIDSGAGSASSAESSMGDINEQTFYELKSLLIQSSDMLNGYYDKINQKLEGQYVLQSDFDAYKQTVTQGFEDLGKRFVAQADFDSYKQENDNTFADLDSKYVSQTDFDAYRQENEQRFSDQDEKIQMLMQKIIALEQQNGTE